MKKLRPSIWNLLFLFFAGIFLSIILHGMLTNDLSPRFGLYLVIDKRTLPVTAPEGVAARLELRALESDPKIYVMTERLPDSTPLRLWLIDATGAVAPMRLPVSVEVGAQGQASAEIQLPPGAIRVYGKVVGEQNRKTVFEAPLG